MNIKHHPFHTRVFVLDGTEFTMDSLTLDQWLSEELSNGYMPSSTVALPSDNSHLRVTTEYQPEKARKHPSVTTDFNPAKPQRQPATARA